MNSHESNAPASPDPTIPHTSQNLTGTQTILLIHGALSSRSEWDLVLPLLTTYHLLIPDLPSHAASASFGPFTLNHAADLLASLIRREARNGVAHVVGLSLGASVAARLASKHPDTVEVLLMTGYGDHKPNPFFTPYLPRLIYAEQFAENLVPRSWIRYLMDGAEIQSRNNSDLSLPVIRELVAALSSNDSPGPIRARTLVVAATKGGIVPSGDSTEHAKRLFKAVEEGGGKGRVVQHRRMRHPWNRQDPRLFAETIRAWIEIRDISEEFEDI